MFQVRLQEYAILPHQIIKLFDEAHRKVNPATCGLWHRHFVKSIFVIHDNRFDLHTLQRLVSGARHVHQGNT
jgi:hypothetical protein